MDRKKIAIFTGNRAEYGLLNPLIRELSSRASFEVYLIISGSHLLEDFGKTVCEIDTSMVKSIRKIPLSVTDANKKVELLVLFSDVIREGTTVLANLNPQFLILAGDRYETFAMAEAIESF